MQRLFTRGVCSAAKEAINTRMSEARVNVEHTYKYLKQLWSSQDFSLNIKIRKAPVALLYKISALLTNFRVCLHKDVQVNAYFDYREPTLEEYLEEGDGDEN